MPSRCVLHGLYKSTVAAPPLRPVPPQPLLPPPPSAPLLLLLLLLQSDTDLDC